MSNVLGSEPFLTPRAGAKSSTDGPLRAELSSEAVMLCAESSCCWAIGGWDSSWDALSVVIDLGALHSSGVLGQGAADPYPQARTRSRT